MSCLTRHGIGMAQSGLATMGAPSLQVQRQAVNGDWVAIPAGGKVLPLETCRMVYEGWGVGNYVVELRIISGADSSTVWGPKQDALLLGRGNQVFTAPNDSTLRSYSAIITTISTPLPFMPKPSASFAFFVDPQAPQPPDTGDKGFGKWVPWIIAGGVVVALVALSPTINRGIGTVLPKRD